MSDDKEIVMTCCEPMRRAQGFTGCNPRVTDQGLVAACDAAWTLYGKETDYGPAMPPMTLCPWCGTPCEWKGPKPAYPDVCRDVTLCDGRVWCPRDPACNE